MFMSGILMPTESWDIAAVATGVMYFFCVSKIVKKSGYHGKFAIGR